MRPLAFWPLNAKYGAVDITQNNSSWVTQTTDLEATIGPYNNLGGAYAFNGKVRT